MPKFYSSQGVAGQEAGVSAEGVASSGVVAWEFGSQDAWTTVSGIGDKEINSVSPCIISLLWDELSTHATQPR